MHIFDFNFCSIKFKIRNLPNIVSAQTLINLYLIEILANYFYNYLSYRKRNNAGIELNSIISLSYINIYEIL
ncbi:hypothetical protein CONCODRAFT_94568 [Conidiobolus coronatus NRRL 28638]|uniref:Uncharacterized protein n=1 Tax=Conidiobolus coronatus (strain ATCC 28846 / CBS 209.66 / NRRL 28638) TaxID=796925 RepID=A0A137P3D0_CONC2|nr:hypothetical protein CONCODRAFT_94568 [Conidiobolus coronatus NRRL 28638]|eukprot:KXN69532.1 hypothetical protein CONCODRAFT_94568 [Conidiobolus coronatus NRRL 28638]